MQIYTLIFLGAGIGGVLRHVVNQSAVRLFGLGFPYGTFLVNVIGAFVLGILVEFYALRSLEPNPIKLFLVIGILGGFTTFSAFTLEVLMLHERGQTILALSYATGSLIFSVGALVAAMSLVRNCC